MSFLLRLCFWLVILFPFLVHAAALENPGNGNSYSGIGVISGWKCEANGELTVRFNGGEPIPLAYLNERSDTEGVCGDTNNGFVSIWNWAILGAGTFTAIVYDNGEAFAQSTFKVTTLGGEEFVRGASAKVSVPDFPDLGDTAHFVWNEGTQHLELDYFTKTDPSLIKDPRALLGTWRFTTTYRDEEHTDNRGEEHTDDWMFSSIGTTPDVVPIAVGLAESRYPAQGGYIQDVAPDLNCKHDYAVYWVSSLSCNILAFNLKSSTRGDGIRAFARPDVLRYFYDSHSRQIDRGGEWLALTDAPSASPIGDSTTIEKVANDVWHFTLSYEDGAGVGHDPYYDSIAATDYGIIPETDYEKWTIDIGKVRLEWDIVAASRSITTDADGAEHTRLAINVRPGARVRNNEDGLPFSPLDLHQEVGEAMSVVQLIEPYSCGPYVKYNPENDAISSENDVITTVSRTRSPRLVSEAEPQDGTALLRAVEEVCE